jgi:hypothetical protein
VERRGGIVFLNTRPPKFSNNGGNSGNKIFGEHNGGHIIDKN